MNTLKQFFYDEDGLGTVEIVKKKLLILKAKYKLKNLNNTKLTKSTRAAFLCCPSLFYNPT